MGSLSTTGRSCLYVLPHPRYFSEGDCGRVTHALGVIEGLRANGVSVTVVTGAVSVDQRLRLERLATLHEVRPPAVGGRPRWVLRLRTAVKSVLRDEGPFSMGIVRYSRLSAPFLRGVFRRWSQVLWVMEVNSLAFQDIPVTWKSLRSAVRAFESLMLAPVSLVYVVSEGIRVDLVGAPFLGPRCISVIPNAAREWIWEASSERFTDPENDAGQQPGRKATFVYLGVLHSYYDFEIIVEAFKRIVAAGVDAELHFFGDGEQRTLVEQLSMGCDRIRLRGVYDLRELVENREFGANHIALLPYHLKSGGVERSPVKLFEYMALGLPIVASRVGQLTSILGDETAAFYEPDDTRSLVEAMRLLAENPERRLAMASEMWARGRDEHTWGRRMTDLLTELEGRSGA